MDRRRSLLVNIGEAETDAVLREVGERLGVRVFVKPRLADAVSIDRSGLPGDLYGYALKAHLDFVVAEEDGRAQFAVEFDEPHHDTDPAARRRDDMKNEICERLGLPLLRIDADYLRTVQGFRLLAWLVELWFLNEAWYEAQVRGSIPWDEPFNYFGFIDTAKTKASGYRAYTYDIAGDARRSLWRAHEEGRTLRLNPTTVTRTTDDSGEAFAFLPVGDDRWLISYVRIRDFCFPPIIPSELAEDLAIVDVAAKLEEFARGQVVAAGKDEFEATVNKLKVERWGPYGISGHD